MQERLIANSVLSRTSFYKGTPCWEWIGAYAVNRNGMRYPKMGTRFTRGPRKGQPRTEYAHRVALKVFRGRRMAKNTKGMHLCNNTMCINPMHCEGGTQRTNIRQCVKDGRHVPGSANQFGAFV